MKKRILSIMLCFVMLAGLLPAAAFAAGNVGLTGAGTADDPYLIGTAEELKAFRDKVNSGESALCAKLTADIVLNDGTFDKDGNWSEDGTPNKWTPINDYTGTFDGQNHTIEGVYVTNEMYAGLFGSVRGGTVKNVAVTGYVEGTRYVGGIVGYGTYATVTGCTNHAAVKAKNEILCVGGIVGCVYEQGIVTGCTNTGAVTAFPIEGSTYWGLGGVGGIVGGASTGSVHNLTAISITACANLGEVSAFIDSDKAGAYVGGIAWEAAGRTIPTDCFNAGDISITERNATCEDTFLGGIVGYATGNVADLPYPYTSNCYSVGTLTHTGSGPVGICGIVGNVVYSRFSVDRCYWLKGTAESGVGGSPKQVTNTDAHTKAEFADGTVLDLLKNNRTDSPWTKTGYLAAAGMTLPLLDWQTADTHTHGEKTGDCTKGILCECGYLMHGAASGHDWSEWRHLTTSHARSCKNPGCGMTQSGNCSGGTATCTAPAVCDKCGAGYGTTDPQNHSGTAKWIAKDASAHEQVYSCCGAVVVADEARVWDGNKCKKCGYGCTHSGGRATCTAPAICDICGAGYGTTDPQNHSGNVTWKKTIVKHIAQYSCCGAAAAAPEDHSWSGGVCRTCGYKCPHNGGTATCTERARCAICGAGYGSTDGENHTGAKQWIAKGESAHEQVYSCCGAVIVADEAHVWDGNKCKKCGYGCSHSGGRATCTAPAVCEKCGADYGATDPQNHTGTAEWVRGALAHTKRYSCCGATAAEEMHEWKNGACAECGYVCVHSGGRANCTEKAKCSACGESYGETDAAVHSDLGHFEAKAATESAEGNIEYWYCAGCGRYFGDAAAAKEISAADTVIAKLNEDKPPYTGDSSYAALWTVLLFACAAAGITISFTGKRKNR